MSPGYEAGNGLPLDPVGVDTVGINDLDVFVWPSGYSFLYEPPVLLLLGFFSFPSAPSAIAPSVF